MLACGFKGKVSTGGQKMSINITDRVVSEFLSGIVAVLALIAVGSVLSYILRGMAKKFPFTRMALILALSPLTLVKFLGQSTVSTLYLFAMIAALLGITIDGINHLLLPKELPEAEPEEATKAEENETATEPGPGVIIWEKAE